jgi:hypothetical protein
MVGEFYFLPFRPLILFALMGFESGSLLNVFGTKAFNNLLKPALKPA